MRCAILFLVKYQQKYNPCILMTYRYNKHLNSILIHLLLEWEEVLHSLHVKYSAHVDTLHLEMCKITCMIYFHGNGLIFHNACMYFRFMTISFFQSSESALKEYFAQVWLQPIYIACFKVYGFLYRLLLAFFAFSNEKAYFIVKFHQIYQYYLKPLISSSKICQPISERYVTSAQRTDFRLWFQHVNIPDSCVGLLCILS